MKGDLTTRKGDLYHKKGGYIYSLEKKDSNIRFSLRGGLEGDKK